MRALLLLPFALLMTAAAPAPERTRVISARDAGHLLAAKAVTLQWLDWNTRGSVHVVRGPVWRLTASQAQAGAPGRLFLDGEIVEIGEGYFTFRGSISITDTTDEPRLCEANKDWHFVSWPPK
jgi:hypothetical protein